MSSITALGSESLSSAHTRRDWAKVSWTEKCHQLTANAMVASNQILSSVWGLLACKCIILVVSAFDIYLTVKYVEFLPELELNPVGRWLLGVDKGPRCDLQQAAAFITAKFAGNVLVLAIIEALAHWGFRRVGFVAGAVALFQILLGIFLCFADTAE